VNQKTGISRLLSGSAGRVQGLVVPNDANTPAAGGPPAPPKVGAAAAKTAPKPANP
jgi:hypothetical protein